MRKICAFLLLTLSLLFQPHRALAHQLDEYLQTTIVDIAPGKIRFQMNLTPGAAVAEKVIALIDRNHDGVISTKEATAYAELLRRDLAVQLDGREIALKLAACNFPDAAELHTGSGIMLMDFTMATSPLAAGVHKLTMENRHHPVASAYLFNAAKPVTATVEITSQTRNENQSKGEIKFTFQPSPATFEKPLHAAK